MADGLSISSGNTTVIACDSASFGLAQIVKLADGSDGSIAMISGSALYGLQVDVSRMPSAAILGIPSVTANIYNTPSVAFATHSVTSYVYNIPSVTVAAGLTVNASVNGIASVALLANPSLTVNASVNGTVSVALLANPSLMVNASVNGIVSVALVAYPSLSVNASIDGIASFALLANPSVIVGQMFGTPSVAPTTHSVTAMIYNTPSVAITATASIAALKKYLNITNAQAAPIVLWSNVQTNRWVMTDLIISSQYSSTVTILDGIDSIGRFYFAARGGMVGNFSTPWKSGGIGSNIMITTAETSSVDITALGYETQ